jgi:hypothetical protein
MIRLESPSPILKTRSKSPFIPLALILCLCIFAIFIASCSRPFTGDSITLEFAANSGNTPDLNRSTDFKEESCFVLRCASVNINELGIVAETSKLKQLKVTVLIFVQPLLTENPSQIYIDIAVAPVAGKEYEYDITQASIFRVTTASAGAAVSSFGITFSDWQTGVINNSGKFPCCQ